MLLFSFGFGFEIFVLSSSHAKKQVICVTCVFYVQVITYVVNHIFYLWSNPGCLKSGLNLCIRDDWKAKRRLIQTLGIKTLSLIWWQWGNFCILLEGPSRWFAHKWHFFDLHWIQSSAAGMPWSRCGFSLFEQKLASPCGWKETGCYKHVSRKVRVLGARLIALQGVQLELCKQLRCWQQTFG